MWFILVLANITNIPYTTKQNGILNDKAKSFTLKRLTWFGKNKLNKSNNKVNKAYCNLTTEKLSIVFPFKRKNTPYKKDNTKYIFGNPKAPNG